MSTFTVTVVIRCDTAEQAQQVLAERIDFAEDYGFEYQIEAMNDLREEAP